MTKVIKTYVIGVDIGGTNMKAVLLDTDSEKIIEESSLATPRDDFDKFMIMFKALLDPLFDKAKEDKIKVRGIGLGVAGIIDYKEEKMLESPNIPCINNTKPVEEIKKMYDTEVKMDNDGNCFVRAEANLGAAKKYNSVYGIIVGTGIGGGWYYNGETYRAVHGGSGEPGEMIMDCSGEAITLEPAYHKLTQGNPANLAEEAYRGDVLAEKTFDEVGRLLGIAFANIVNLLAPEAIVVGGGVTGSGDLFLSKARKTMREYIASDEVRKRIKLLKSKLGEHAGAIGAALLIK
jgi:predicted NBD/HSP70 family sugar kinase